MDEAFVGFLPSPSPVRARQNPVVFSADQYAFTVFRIHLDGVYGYPSRGYPGPIPPVIVAYKKTFRGTAIDASGIGRVDIYHLRPHRKSIRKKLEPCPVPRLIYRTVNSRTGT